MDLQYYDDNSGKWISLKVQSDTNPNNDSTFTTPRYIINNLIKKQGDFVKYYDETENYTSKIELLSAKIGNLCLKDGTKN